MSDKTEHPPIPDAFAALGVRPSILRALAELKFTQPSEIQALLIPRALAGVDLLGQARTGTGKTAAFAIPVLSKAHKGVATQAIILVPTRELAVQVDAEIQRLGQYTPIRSVPVYGGQKIAAQMKFLKHNPEILVGTPGRVIDLLDRGLIHFENIRFVILDEVDRMLDIGFRDDIRNILTRIRSVRREMARHDERQSWHDERQSRDDERQSRNDQREREDETPTTTILVRTTPWMYQPTNQASKKNITRPAIRHLATHPARTIPTDTIRRFSYRPRFRLKLNG